jgi:hypothetical protein
LLSIVAPNHFVELFVEPDGDDFWFFSSTIKPKDSIVELTTNALMGDSAYAVNIVVQS